MTSGLKTAALLGGLSALFMLIGGYLGGEQGMIFAFGVALVMNVGSYWFSDKIVLRMYNAQEVGQDHPLYRVTQRLAQKAGLPMPKVYVIPEVSPNAFATGRDPQHAAGCGRSRMRSAKDPESRRRAASGGLPSARAVP